MTKQRLSLTSVSFTAISVVDRDGFDGLSLSSVAQELGVVPSALYTHVDGLDGLRYLVAVTATGTLTERINQVAIGTAGGHALEAMGQTYRGFAQAHPGQFASTLLPPQSEADDLAEANKQLLNIFILVFGGMGLPADQARLAARSTRSAIHGFLSLELIGGTTKSHDEEYAHLLHTLQRGLAK